MSVSAVLRQIRDRSSHIIPLMSLTQTKQKRKLYKFSCYWQNFLYKLLARHKKLFLRFLHHTPSKSYSNRQWQCSFQEVIIWDPHKLPVPRVDTRSLRQLVSNITIGESKVPCYSEIIGFTLMRTCARPGQKLTLLSLRCIRYFVGKVASALTTKSC